MSLLNRGLLIGLLRAGGCRCSSGYSLSRVSLCRIRALSSQNWNASDQQADGRQGQAGSPRGPNQNASVA
jgi:hypothetical protein